MRDETERSVFKIDIIVPIFNEIEVIEEFLSSLKQIVKKEAFSARVWLVDGGSDDGTWECLEKFVASEQSAVLLVNQQRYQSTALNQAIEISDGDFVARLDAHSVYQEDYLEKCLTTSLATEADVVGGVVQTVPFGNAFQSIAIAMLSSHFFGVGNSPFRRENKSGYVDTVPFGFFKRKIFEKVGLFDPRLVRCQDFEFNQRVIGSGGRIYLNSAIKTKYYNKSKVLVFLKKQLFLEGPYNAYMWYLAPKTLKIRHSVTAFFVSGLFLGIPIILVAPMLAFFYVGTVFLYLLINVFSSLYISYAWRSLKHLPFLILFFPSFHLCHGLGVIMGLLKLVTGVAPVQNSNN